MVIMIFVWFYTFAKVWNALTNEITLQISLKSHLKIYIVASKKKAKQPNIILIIMIGE